MNIASYPLCTEKIEHFHATSCSYGNDALEQIFENGESYNGGRNITDLQEENAAVQEWETENWNILTNQHNFTYARRSIPQDKAKFDIGVSAMEWNVDPTTTILVFRGTFSHGDFANIEHWMVDYLLERSTDRMKEAWVDDAGLQWTTEMQDRFKDDTLDKLEIRAALRTQERGFPQELVDAISANTTLQQSLKNGGLTLQDAKQTGYWKLTKYIIDEVYANVISQNRTLILTGHSQGGTRAQLASMYLQHEYGVKVPTISFAGTGSACMTRHQFATKGNFLRDVDPYYVYDQIVEYVHPLDPWGNSMLGQDNGGRVCYFGTSKLLIPTNTSISSSTSSHDPAYKYCSRIYGWSGPALVANEHLSSPDEDLRNNFRRCRYFTHNPKAMFMSLSGDGVLHEDGTTDGGCRAIPVITIDDPNGTCPTGSLALKEKEAVGVIVVVVVLLILVPCWCCYRFWKRIRRHRNSKRGYDLSALPLEEDYYDEEEESLDDDMYFDEEPTVTIELPRVS
jgi:Lipase (class 3)